MTLDRLTQITSVGITSGITLNNATLTGVTTIASLDSVSVGGTITAVNGTFSGNVSIAGTLTYEDVTNIDSVGLITARSGINIENAAPTLNLIDTDGSTTSSLLGNSGNIYYSTSSSNRDHIFRGSTTEVARITGDGNVGIGTDNPATKLHLSSGTATQITVSNTSSSMPDGDTIGTIDFTAGPNHTTNARVAGLVEGTSEAGGDLVFETRADGGSLLERLRITSSGNLGIGTDNPNTLLDIEKNMTQDDNIGFLRILNTAALTNSGSNTSLIVQNNNVRCQFFAWEANGIRMGVRNKLNTGSGNVYITAGNDTVRLTIDAATGNFTGSASADISDGRLKENIQNISATDAVNIIKGLQGRTFTWKAEANMGTDTKYGFIAQEVESILPNLVHQTNGINRVSKDADKQGYGKGEIIDDYSDSYKDDTQSEWSKSVEKTGIIPILVEALKDSIAKIETLESEVASLKAAQ